MATLHLTGATTVANLREQFNAAFGSQVKIYNGGRLAEPTATLAELGLKADADFSCYANLTVGSFIERMKENHGLKVKVYTCDEWVAVLDGLTLEASGKVKKNATKADMENLIAYQRTDNNLNGYELMAEEDGSYTVTKDGVVCDNTKAAMREIAALIGFEYDTEWNTRQFGKKLLAALNGETKIESPLPKTAPQPNPAPVVDNSAQEAAAKAKAEAEKAKAELARAKAEAEAEAAKAELARIKAEAAKAQAEAEAARKAAAKAQADAAKAEKEAAAPAPAAPAASKTSSNKGALNGMFSVAANKKVRFSMGNLQFNPKKYEFRFALHQYDVIGADNSKIAPNYDGWIDLFGYGTSGYMGCEPTETNSGNQYRQDNIANTNYDWGVYNPISNGGNKEGIWRTLTREEWYYLFNERLNAAKLRAKACVNGINGGILLPDDFYEHRVRVPFDSTPDSYAGNTYDLAQWAILEEAGAIFLPCCGRRKGTTVTDVATSCSFWTSSGHNGQYNGVPAARNAYLFGTDYNESYYGRPVRLVQDVK